MMCTTCFTLTEPGQKLTEYKEHAGSQVRNKACHADYADCQSALASEGVRYARICTASANGGRVHYENTREGR